MATLTNDFLRQPELAACLPDSRDWRRGDALPKGLIGATIQNIGTYPDSAHHIEGGGLVIDYLPVGAHQSTRVVLAFNENGMWVEAEVAMP